MKEVRTTCARSPVLHFTLFLCTPFWPAMACCLSTIYTAHSCCSALLWGLLFNNFSVHHFVTTA